jgi:short-subunit dehydrogenase
VISSRNAEALARIADDLRAMGTEAEWLAGDVGDERAMRELARVAVHVFGRIDTWVNNAGVGIYGELEKTPLGDARRLFETNYWGMVHGALAALPHLRQNGGRADQRGKCGERRAHPAARALRGQQARGQGLHRRAAHGAGARRRAGGGDSHPPGSIDTPFTEHAHNHMEGADPEIPPPVYAPEVVADAILHCAEHPRRELIVGGSRSRCR